MSRLAGKVAVITGGARGQGRAHAIQMAREGAQIVVCDIADQIASVPYPMGTADDLAETVAQVEALDRRCLGITADARDPEQMGEVIGRAVSEFGGIDTLVVNHAICVPGSWDTPEEVFGEVVSVNLNAVFTCCRAGVPHLIERGGGSIVLISSGAGLRPVPHLTAYSAAKHGVIGLMRSLSVELAPHRIRVNAVCPGFVNTPMVVNDTFINMFAGKESGGTIEEMAFGASTLALLPEPWLEPSDISHAVVYLASDESRFVTGIEIPVDLGTNNQPAGVPPVVAKMLGGQT
jgi:(+)-trans-carveol dehydrogenase